MTWLSTSDGIGGSLSAGASWDSATVSVAGLSRDLDTLLEVLAEHPPPVADAGLA